MEKKTVLIKRYPSRGELPKAEQHVIVGWNEEPLSTRIANRSESGYWFLSDDACDCDEPDYWLEEIEIPSDDDMEDHLLNHRVENRVSVKRGMNYILNHLKSNTNGN